ncbi:DMT family transporter [Patescibacteria group bacterium]|nr:DMT family transporter [Patescibacteria group bacterium]MBU1124005.1 DMT family transporter [Patescibacteria group bacterium]MBU1911366.1 DMT family transporter [Patescibacteria group bacterium]
MTSKQERIGELMLLATCVFEGFYPVIAHIASDAFPPIFFTGSTASIAALLFALYSIVSGRFIRKVPLRGVLLATGVVAFNFTAWVLLLVGAKSTSGINTALLLQAEMVFTFIFTTVVLRERLTPMQLWGVLTVFGGTMFILYNGSVHLNRGDLIIIGATALFPIGNTFAKKALDILTPDYLLFLRYLIGGTTLMIISLFVEDLSGVRSGITREILWIFPVYIVLIMVVSKVLWYNGLKRLPLGRCIYIFSATPAFGLVIAMIILKEVPTLYQFGGLFIVMGGVYLLMKRRRELEMV